QERQLRGLLGLPAEDGTRLVPSDTPTVAPYTPDWDTSVQEALTLKPELYLARQEVKAAQLNLIQQKNQLLPDVRGFMTYDGIGVGARLDGADPNNAFRSLSSNHFNNWSVGVNAVVPIGYRSAYSRVRQFELQLARTYAILQDNERKVQLFLALNYRRVFLAYEQIRANRAAREAFAQQLTARFQEFIAGRGTLDILLEAQRFWANALSTEYQSIRDYNQALAAFEFAKGTTLQRNNVVISEGALPGCAQERAVEHLNERSAALKVRYRPDPATLP